MFLDFYVSIYNVPWLLLPPSRTAHNVLHYVFAEAFLGGTLKKCSTQHNVLQYVGGEAQYGRVFTSCVRTDQSYCENSELHP